MIEMIAIAKIVGISASLDATLSILPSPGTEVSPTKTSDIIDTFIPKPNDWTTARIIYDAEAGK